MTRLQIHVKRVRSGQSVLSYGGTLARSFLDFVGPLHGTVLDIGAGQGVWGPALRQSGAERLVAIEPDKAAAYVARSRYDKVVEGRIEETASAVIFEADVIILADCLEHLLDPWRTLKWLHDSSNEGTRLVVSTPNLRFLGILLPVLLAGRFEYSDSGGVMDRGHVRWFTRSSLKRALLSSGWSVGDWAGESGTGKRAYANRLTFKVAAELLCHQIYMSATRASDRQAPLEDSER